MVITNIIIIVTESYSQWRSVDKVVTPVHIRQTADAFFTKVDGT